MLASYIETARSCLDDNDLEGAEDAYAMAVQEVKFLSPSERADAASTLKNLDAAMKRRGLLGECPPSVDGGVARLESSTSTLLESRRALADTEELATSVLEDLSKQNAVLKSTIDKTKELNDEVSVGRRLLRKMSRWWNRV